MASSYLNIIAFLLTTLFYSLALKPQLKYEQLTDPQKYSTFKSNNFMYLGIYLLLVMIIQFMVNASIISTKCGGNITENMGSAGLVTFIPWMLIFGVIIMVLTIYPGFKTAFSDVIGYYYVSKDANKFITELLVEQSVQDKLNSTATTAENTGQKKSLEEAADLIVKIMGNKSILINQMVPDNFAQFWTLLKPLMKPRYQNDSDQTTQELRNKLFDLVVTRDNIGEIMWYIYTGLLLTSIVQLKITSRGCQTTTQTMEQNYQTFLENEQKQKQQQALTTDTTYTITD